MASITDCVVEGLKYPLSDIKRLLSFGALLALIDVLYLVLSIKSLDGLRIIKDIHMVNFSRFHGGDIGIIVLIGALIFILYLIMMGYQYKVVKFSIEKKDDLPGFNDIVNIFVSGVKYFIVCTAYYLIPIIVMVLGLMLVHDSSLVIYPMVIAGILFLISSFILIMALNNLVAHDNLAKAFDFGEIIGNIRNLGWVKYIGTVIFTFIVFMIIMVAAGFVMTILTVVFTNIINNHAIFVAAFIGILEGLLINSYGAVFLNRVFGSIYRESIK